MKTVIQLGNILPTKTRSNPNQGRVYDINGICPCVTNLSGGGGRQPFILTYEIQSEISKMRKHYRIRKLTPRECFRLMGVPEKDLQKMLDINSNTQCYKQAGNSIVVPALMALFSQMNIDGVKSWNEMSEDKIYEMIERCKWKSG